MTAAALRPKMNRVPSTTAAQDTEIENMKREASQGNDIAQSDIFSGVIKVIAVAGIIGVTTILATAAQPVISTVIDSFPHPATEEPLQ